MDSGNSGSMQSSSTGGGDEEYDSRTESISPFSNPSGHCGSVSNIQPTDLSHHQSHPSSLFDSPSHNLGAAFSQSVTANPSANSLYNNLNLVWSRSGLRSDPNYTELGNLTDFSSSSPSSLLAAQLQNQDQFPSSSSMPLRFIDGNGGRASLQTDQTNVVKNSKKRTRASRRAPTTVLTTDTSNFRQMVQEFTGIPAPPFSASPYSRRLDLFGSTGSTLRTGHLEPLGHLYPLRPSVHKVQPSPFASSSSSPSLLSSTIIDAIAPTTSTNNNITSSIGVSNYQQPSDLGLLRKQPQNMLNMQNPILPFQSLLQSPTPSFKYPLANTPVFGSKTQGSIDEFGMSHDQHVNANLSDGRRDSTNVTRWRDEAASNSGGRDQDQLGSFDGNINGNNSHVGGSGSFKLNCSASTSDHFHPHEKGLENVSSRGEGTVDSWICPSD